MPPEPLDIALPSTSDRRTTRTSGAGATLARDLGSAVRQLRDARGWSQEELADHAGLNRSFVGEIERGEVTVSLSSVAKLAHAFGIMPSALVGHGEAIGVARVLRESALMALGA